MRTTLSIDDQLLKKAKRLSIDRQCTLGAVVEEALRLSLEKKPSSDSEKASRPLKTYRGKGLQAGIDLNSNASVLERMEE
jgi:hypothetical protein